MQLNKIEDPRDMLNKLSRKELEYLGRLEGRDFAPGMPAELMKARFRSEPPSRMPQPMRGTLGSQARLIVPKFEIWEKVAFGERPPVEQKQEIREVDALSDLEEQWLKEAKPQAVVNDYKLPPIVKLRRECKERGIPWKNTDKVADLEARIHGQNAS